MDYFKPPLDGIKSQLDTPRLNCNFRVRSVTMFIEELPSSTNLDSHNFNPLFNMVS